MEPTPEYKPEERVPYNTTPVTPPAETPVPATTPVTAAPVDYSAPQQPLQTPVSPSSVNTNTPGAIILQWLTYAFWGWLVVGLIWLITVILINAILKEAVNTVVPYAIAATVILLPIAFFCDLFYRKHEPSKKVGAAMVIMVIHAVLFALLCIGSLIIAAFTGINMAINLGDGLDSQLVLLLTAIFATVLYAAAFLRTLNPFKSNIVPRAYSIAMLGVTVVLLIAAIAGPIASSIATRDDRKIEESLPTISTAVGNFITRNDKLPASLNDITLNDEQSKSLIKENKVEYIAEGTSTDITTLNRLRSTSGAQTYRYQLCVDYAAKKESSSRYGYAYDYDYSIKKDGYSSYVTTSTHGEGRTCYKLEARG
jgi:hypothetical protein